jgi:hypothetical protein
VLALRLDKEIARHRLFTDGRSFLDDPKLKPQIEENWRFIFQEPLVPRQAVSRSGSDQRNDDGPKATITGQARRKDSRRTGRQAKRKKFVLRSSFRAPLLNVSQGITPSGGETRL